MKTRVRMGFKPSAKSIVGVDVTVDVELEDSETVQAVGLALSEAVAEFKKQVVAIGYKNAEIVE